MSAPKKRPSTIWTRASLGREASAGYDLAANIIVGIVLGWLAQRWFPGLKPWGYFGGIVLGAASGFYQLFKSQQPKPKPKADEQDHA